MQSPDDDNRTIEKLTPEAVENLRQLFNQLDTEQTGYVRRKQLIDTAYRVGVAKHCCENLQSIGNYDDPIDFDEFCNLLVKISPSSLELLYQSWIHRTATDLVFRELDEELEPATSPVIVPAQSIDHLVTLSKSFIAGGCAGIISKSCLAPIDRVKIIFQVTERRFSLSNALQLMRRIYHQDGFRALFRGNSATVLRVMPYAGIQHSSFDYFRRKLMVYNESHGTDSRLSNKQLILSGSLAGGLSVMLTYPLDILRARLVVQQGSEPSAGLFKTFMNTYRSQGIQSFAKGLAPTLLGIFPYTGIGFALNEKFKGHLLQYMIKSKSDLLHENRLPTLAKFGCSYFAASIAQSFTYPLDTVRRRMQTEGFVSSRSSASATPPAQIYTSILGTARHIMQQEGWRGLYKGLSVNWLRSPIATGISLTAYDTFKELLNVEKI